MSTQNEIAAYLSGLLREKKEQVKEAGEQVKELTAALEKFTERLQNLSKEEEFLTQLCLEQEEKGTTPVGTSSSESTAPDDRPLSTPEKSAPEPSSSEVASPEPESEKDHELELLTRAIHGTPPETKPPEDDKGSKKGGKKTKGRKTKEEKGKPGGVRQITRGARPPLKKTMHDILGRDRIMTAPEMLEALTEKGFAPKSTQPQVLVSWTFSNNKDAFIRVSHGKYRANPNYRPRNSQAPSSLSQEEVNSELSEMGLGDLRKGGHIENPFRR
jgi:hypothetical protein